MKIPLEVIINPTGKPDVYKSLERAEEFLLRLLNSETSRELARECQIEAPRYIPSHPVKLHRALGFSHASEKTHSFSCWEQIEGEVAREVGVFTCLAGKNGAAEHNGNVAREWKQSGGEKAEEEAGIHLLYRNGRIVKRLWIETNRRTG
jgi:hypothetical protein